MIRVHRETTTTALSEDLQLQLELEMFSLFFLTLDLQICRFFKACNINYILIRFETVFFLVENHIQSKIIQK